MKVKITKVEFRKEVETKFGVMQSFNAEYNDKRGGFMCKSKENPTFEAGKEYDIVETEREYKGNTYYNIKLIPKQGGNFGRAIKREQSKYSGFAMSYAKDLVIAEKIELKEIANYTKKMFALMVELDKTLDA